MLLRLGLALLLLAAGLSGEKGSVTVRDLVTIVHEGVRQGTSDKALAKSLAKLKLNESLDERTVEELESDGAGPQSVRELKRLMDDSSYLVPPAAPAIPSPPPPSAEEQKRFFALMSKNALAYSAGLPDFICAKHVKRLSRGREKKDWLLEDDLVYKVTYFEAREKSEIMLVNGRLPLSTYVEKGTTFEGDFGNSLLLAFQPGRGTVFSWHHWTRFHNRLTHVYSFRVGWEASSYTIGQGDLKNRLLVGRHGWIYGDAETGMVMRLSFEADQIPPGYPITANTASTDYGYFQISGRRFLLPAQGEVTMETDHGVFRNLIAYRDYRKFSSESSISFDNPN